MRAVDSPQVSVIIPLYNKAEYVLQTVESVRAQTFTDWELVVVDNLSTDCGPEQLRELGEPRLRLLSCKQKGVSAARNVGIESARGQWILFLDADDLVQPTYIESQLSVAKSSDAQLVMCRYAEFIDGSSPSDEVRWPIAKDVSLDRLLSSAIVFCPGPQHIFFVRRDLIRKENYWPEDVDRLLGEDAVFWFKLLNEAKFAFNPAVLASYRVSTPQSRFTNLSDPATMLEGLTGAINENINYLASRNREITAGQAETIMRFYANVYFRARTGRLSTTSSQALTAATHWQQQYFRKTLNPTLGMRLRRWLGLPLFATLFRHA
jgi:glycosyltransferase involved in cell wall biosynthesis